MNRAGSLEDLKAKLATAADLQEYQLFFVALLGAAANVPPDDLIMVGGSAIENYTQGKYTSQDIDLVSSDSVRLKEVLSGWQFKKDGRVWINPNLAVVVDLVRYPYSGNLERTTFQVTAYGAVRLAAIEDLIVKRLASVKFWKVAGDEEQAQMLAEEFFDVIDWVYLEGHANREDVGDLLKHVQSKAARRSNASSGKARRG